MKKLLLMTLCLTALVFSNLAVADDDVTDVYCVVLPPTPSILHRWVAIGWPHPGYVQDRTKGKVQCFNQATVNLRYDLYAKTGPGEQRPVAGSYCTINGSMTDWRTGKVDVQSYVHNNGDVKCTWQQSSGSFTIEIQGGS